mmetsp:Transcript_26741/g.75551  ORF Transcript_26741/g.75551 Transcript_26741/m.75551 type:complete len:290 (-) Transcript_26741:121-990(-)
MALCLSRFRWTASSMRRSCSTLSDGSLPDRSTTVSDSFDSIAFTNISPACAVMPFFDSMRTWSAVFSDSAFASSMMPFCELPLAVRLLLSRLSDRRVLFFFSASPIASAERTPRLLPSHSSFCRCMFFSIKSASDTPSSSLRPLRFRSKDMQEWLFSIACVRSRRRTELSSIPQSVMSALLVFFVSASRSWSRPPSIFFLISSSSRRFRSCSRRCCSRYCCCFLACCSRCRRMASSCSFCFLWSSASFFRRLSSSCFRFLSSSVRFVCGSTSTQGLKVRFPRMSVSSAS